jgi:hypothetical protein
MDDVDRRYEMMDCSSEKVDWSSLAMYVARADEAEFNEGIEFEA